MFELALNAIVVPLAGVAVGVLGVFLLALVGRLGPCAQDQQRAEDQGPQHLLS